jgi:hypothetical protein
MPTTSAEGIFPSFKAVVVLMAIVFIAFVRNRTVPDRYPHLDQICCTTDGDLGR